MARGSDVVVVGAGIVGAACAYELAKRGASVTLLEYGKAGMQATNAAAGLLTPYAESEGPNAMFRIGALALREFPQAVAGLEERCGFSLEYQARGLLRVAFDQVQAASLQRRFAWQRELGLQLEWLDASMCREMEPRLSPRVIAGVFSAAEATISNQQLALALTRSAVASGAVLHEAAPLGRVTRNGRRIVSVEAGGETYSCDTVVLAAGARSGQVAERFRVVLPVFPIRGQMIALGGMTAPIQRPLWGSEGYLVPRANGLVFAGATVEDVGFRRRTTRAGVRGLRAMAVRLVPQLRAAAMHFDWAGLRPCTPDRMPIIGPAPLAPNVVAATGHYRSGILLGPLTGRLVANGILNGDWSAVPAEFSPHRFAQHGE